MADKDVMERQRGASEAAQLRVQACEAGRVAWRSLNAELLWTGKFLKLGERLSVYTDSWSCWRCCFLFLLLLHSSPSSSSSLTPPLPFLALLLFAFSYNHFQRHTAQTSFFFLQSSKLPLVSANITNQEITDHLKGSLWEAPFSVLWCDVWMVLSPSEYRCGARC